MLSRAEVFLEIQLAPQVTIGKLTSITQPLRITNVQALEYNIATTHSTTSNIYFSMDIECIDNPNIDVKTLGIQFGVSEVKLVGGPLIVEMSHMIRKPPFFSGIQAYFVNPPKVDIKFTGAARAMEIAPGLEIRKHIERAVAGAVVSPNRIGYVMTQEVNYFELMSPFPTGILEFVLRGGEALSAKYFGTTWESPKVGSCIVQVGGQSETIELKKKPDSDKPKSSTTSNTASKDFFTHQHLKASTLVKITCYSPSPSVYKPTAFLFGQHVAVGQLEISLDKLINETVELSLLNVAKGSFYISGNIYPVIQDHITEEIEPDVNNYLFLCGIEKVDKIPTTTETVQVDTVFTESVGTVKYTESTGAFIVQPQSGNDDTTQGSEKPQKAQLAFNIAYFWPSRELNGLVSITLKAKAKGMNNRWSTENYDDYSEDFLPQMKDVGTYTFNITEFVANEQLRFKDTTIEMNPKDSEHNVLTMRFEWRAIDRRKKT
eukprot:GEMP01018347.1.p1 GENE.GEMP01018347.1~~GEMP01018347.1.p1  ORF type:complete len:489 (+),score=71.77 GEMP01018347.1:676-2142(+)